PRAARAVMRWGGLGLVIGIAAVAFAAVTLVALEGREVVRLRTITPDGGTRTTRTWVADWDGAMWIEAANDQRPFLLDLQARPDVELVRGGHPLPLHAIPVPGPDGHRRMRALLAEKYGWADPRVRLLPHTPHPRWRSGWSHARRRPVVHRHPLRVHVRCPET